jgi:putative transposase
LLRTKAAVKPSKEGTPVLSIVAEDQDRPGLEVDLDALVREGARRMLVTALKLEVDAYIAAHAEDRDDKGHALVVRNGVAQPRKVTTAAGELEIEAPRVDDRHQGHRFTSKILPPWARRSPKVTEVLPVLYLRGISTKDFARHEARLTVREGRSPPASCRSRALKLRIADSRRRGRRWEQS